MVMYQVSCPRADGRTGSRHAFVATPDGPKHAKHLVATLPLLSNVYVDDLEVKPLTAEGDELKVYAPSR